MRYTYIAKVLGGPLIPHYLIRTYADAAWHIKLYDTWKELVRLQNKPRGTHSGLVATEWADLDAMLIRATDLHKNIRATDLHKNIFPTAWDAWSAMDTRLQAGDVVPLTGALLTAVGNTPTITNGYITASIRMGGVLWFCRLTQDARTLYTTGVLDIEILRCAACRREIHQHTPDGFCLFGPGEFQCV